MVGSGNTKEVENREAELYEVVLFYMLGSFWKLGGIRLVHECIYCKQFVDKIEKSQVGSTKTKIVE